MNPSSYEFSTMSQNDKLAVYDNQVNATLALERAVQMDGFAEDYHLHRGDEFFDFCLTRENEEVRAAFADIQREKNEQYYEDDSDDEGDEE